MGLTLEEISGKMEEISGKSRANETPQDTKDESDPTGRAAHEPGAKMDQGKNRLGLVLGDFSHALKAVGEIGTFGANKYSAHGWTKVPGGAERYTDALYRHLLDEACGESIDTDSGLNHAAHTAWNALARLELKLRENER